MPLAALDFSYVQDIVQRSSAIVLSPGKEYLVESRLAPLAQCEGFASLGDMITNHRRTQCPKLQGKIIDFMTTNESSFFRDLHPFEALQKDLLPKIIAARRNERVLRIWSAACSSGQEIYSIAMLLIQHFPELSGWKIQLLATDLSPTMINRARRGVFNQIEVNRGLPGALLVRHFTKKDNEWTISEPIRRMVEFREMNLVRPWTILDTFDIIFLRNVLIYFDAPTKKLILNRMRERLRPDGGLFLGGAETTFGFDEQYRRITAGNAVWYQPIVAALVPANPVPLRA